MERNNAVSVSQGRADQDEDKSQRERGFGGVLGHSAGIIGGTDSVGGLAEPYVFPGSESCEFGTGPWLSLIYSWRRYSNSSIIIFLSLFGLLKLRRVSGAGVVLLPNPCGATKQSGKSSNFTIEYSKSVPLTYPTRLVAIRLFR